MQQLRSTVPSPKITKDVRPLEQEHPVTPSLSLEEFMFLHDINIFIDISMIYCPHVFIFTIVDIINVKEFFVRKQNPWGVFFSEICSKPVCKLFPV